MEKSTIINYVCENATVQESLVRNAYCVRFPTPHSSKFFTANDVETLLERVWEFCQTDEGRKLISQYDFTAYTDEFYIPNGEEE